MTKSTLFEKTARLLAEQGFTIVEQDDARPWGGFFVIDETQANRFIETYFPTEKPANFAAFAKLSPKILMVAPGKRLSWQYHFRRAEIWQVVEGTVGVVTSPTDEEGELKTYRPGDLIRLAKGERHRLVGLDDWGVIAEIWQHTDPENPSDEDDIVRLKDDYRRS
jgi:mannose-6-phosphate isomerase-like protein (cupin superfamily)